MHCQCTLCCAIKKPASHKMTAGAKRTRCMREITPTPHRPMEWVRQHGFPLRMSCKMISCKGAVWWGQQREGDRSACSFFPHVCVGPVALVAHLNHARFPSLHFVCACLRQHTPTPGHDCAAADQSHFPTYADASASVNDGNNAQRFERNNSHRSCS